MTCCISSPYNLSGSLFQLKLSHCMAHILLMQSRCFAVLAAPDSPVPRSPWWGCTPPLHLARPFHHCRLSDTALVPQVPAQHAQHFSQAHASQETNTTLETLEGRVYSSHTSSHAGHLLPHIEHSSCPCRPVVCLPVDDHKSGCRIVHSGRSNKDQQLYRAIEV